MEEKKLDLNTIIGYVLIFGIIIGLLYFNTPSQAELDKKAKQEQAEKAKANPVKPAENVAAIPVNDTTVKDSAAIKKLQGALGGFAYSATIPSAKDAFTTIENDLVSLKIANKGGYIVEAKLKKFEKFKKGSGELVELIKDNNASLNIQLQTQDNRTLETKNLYFEPTLTKSGNDQILAMRLKASSRSLLRVQICIESQRLYDGFCRAFARPQQSHQHFKTVGFRVEFEILPQ
ncbi:YidC/Oxa1 family insertase periplasmic-domain containing protein [Flavobacterium sp. 3HN19-14]|uniref:YidC/Oxa1 family insertase periplasmic-domain containing protein n=1 Tax=Flavobacterium sp. 3HN19-14 TaxID=3448133 RepID=UPI003EE122EC